ncbi:MAG: permease-like cell division protein FtsX [Bacilli bacterium]|nr:permease-like cell division protein FtsX [Bacilli bacterium]
MKIIRIIGKGIKDAFKSVFRNFSLSIASISCIAITLVIVAIALIATYNVNNITKKIEGVLEIVVFIDREADEDDEKYVGESINKIANVDSDKTVFNTKEELATQLREEDPNMALILDTLDENPLQASYIVSVKDVTKISDTAEEINEIQHVTSVRYGENIVNRLLNVFSILRNGCLVAVVALIVVTAFLVGNTIKITIFSRRQEIQIMRLVGTSNTVIKLPFLVEGFVLGIIGGLIALGISLFAYYFIFDYTNGTLFTNLAPLVSPSSISINTAVVLLAVGGLVGMFGSIMSARKYLKI